jgi:hypothetical protein
MRKAKMDGYSLSAVGLAEQPYWRLNPVFREIPYRPAMGSSRLLGTLDVGAAYDFPRYSPANFRPGRKLNPPALTLKSPAIPWFSLKALKNLVNRPLAQAGREGFLEPIHPVVKEALIKTTILTIKGLI